MARRVTCCVLVLLLIFAMGSGEALASSLLKLGSRGASVKEMQQKLIELGYLQGRADGIFGPMTRKAVIQFQKDKGLGQDGIAGPRTLSALYSSAQPSVGGSPQPQNRGNSVIARTLKVGTRGSDVKALQERLKSLGFECGTPDGIFGPGTRAAVMRFQQTYGLKADGIAGTNTLSKLFAGQTSSGEPPAANNNKQSGTPSITGVLKRGSRGNQVAMIQRRLNELGFNAGIADGIFGWGTYNAVVAFQKSNGLVADGIVGSSTIAMMYQSNPADQYEEFHGTPGELEGKVVILDPGHGGWDTGAHRNGVLEKDLNLDMARRLKRMLEEAGARVLMTRTEDKYYSLFYRSAFANRYVLSTELSKLASEKGTLINEKNNAIVEKTQKELLIRQKNADSGQLQQKLVQKQNQLNRLIMDINILEAQRFVLEQEYDTNRALYEQKVNQHSKESAELQSLEAALQGLNSQSIGLEAELATLQDNQTLQQARKQSLAKEIENLQNEINLLRQKIDDPNSSDEAKNDLMQQYESKQQVLLAKQSELDSTISNLDTLKKQIYDKESQLNSVKQQVSIKQAEIALKEGSLHNLENAIAIAKVDMNKTQDNLNKLVEELETKQVETEVLRNEISTMNKEIPANQEDIQRLESEVPMLAVKIQMLERDIALISSKINDLNSKMSMLQYYIDNPALNDREGIYDSTLDEETEKNHANEELVEIFELTRNNYQDDTIFISIHCNATVEDETNSSGVQVYYRDNGPISSWGTYGVNIEYYLNYNEEKRRELAQNLLDHLSANTNFSNKYPKPFKVDFNVLRENNLVSALVEVGFINNAGDRALLVQDQTRENAAKGMYKGIVQYFKQD